MEYLKKQKI